MVMNTRDSVYAVVKENEERLHFKGVETETAEVSVDNSTKEIAVDVLVENILGTEKNKAYPGVRGLLQEDILSAEIDRAKTSEKSIKAELNHTRYALQQHMNDQAEELNNRVTELQKHVDSEFDRVDDDISKLTEKTENSLFKLSSEMRLADTELHDNLQTLQENLSDDIDKLNNRVRVEFNRLQEEKSDKGHTHELVDITDYANFMSEFDSSIKQHVENYYVTKDTFESSLKDLSDYSDETYSTKKDVSQKISIVNAGIQSIAEVVSHDFDLLTTDVNRINVNVQNADAEIQVLKKDVKNLDETKSETTHNHNIENLEGYNSLFDKFVTHIPSEYITEAELNKALDDSIGNIDFSAFVEKNDLTSLFLSKVNSIGGCTSADFKI
jgi:hypothetical protein